MAGSDRIADKVWADDLRRRGLALLASCFGDDGRGGIVHVDAPDVEVLDPISSTGLAYGDGRLVRLLRAPAELTGTTELLVYDSRGVAEYRRLDQVRDPHDVIPHDGGWLVVSTGSNEILHVAGGTSACVFSGPRSPDAWHVNCVVKRDGDIWASAFGRFTTFKGWRDDVARGAGFLWNLRTGEEITGFSHPHTPRFVDGTWLVCSSLDNSLERLDERGHRLRHVPLGGYTRGVAVDGHRVFVGISSPRGAPQGRAEVVVLDRARLEPVGRVALPSSEVYDLVIVPAEMLAAVRRGFRTNAFRWAVHGDAPIGSQTPREPIGLLLDQDAVACTVHCAVPQAARAGEEWLLDVEVVNRGRTALASVPPHPVFIASRWADVSGRLREGDRAPLPVAIAPGERTRTVLPVRVPEPGVHVLRVSLVHERHFWFDEIDPGYGVAREVSVSTGKE